ncbi:alcohol oxidase [Mycena rebaudengoi]|nr:alcohol oxidase [Mycena rebaudengoi]
MFSTLYLFLLAIAATGHCKIYTAVSDLPTHSFDFIVVGGGTAGSAVANRLTENPKFSVLVLEAGPSNEGVVEAEAPSLVLQFDNQAKFHWNYTTTPQPGLNGRAIPYSRARTLGGCSAHNGMFYTRGSREDFDRYAQVTGDAGWSWDRLLPYFFKNEKWTEPADHHDTRGQYDPRVHGTKGMVSVSLAGYEWPASRRVTQATREFPEQFPFNLDTNAGNPLGIGFLQETIGQGQRSSASTSYLGPKFQSLPNLHILLNAQVSRLIANKTNNRIVFNGVEFSQDQSTLSTVVARKEVILSAGTIGTPSILLHSGVGDKIVLQALGISSILDLPSVGKNVSDHPSVVPTWSVPNDTETVESVSQNMTRFNEAFAEWNKTKTGPFSVIAITHVGWFRIPGIFNRFSDPAAGPRSPHIELKFGAGGGGLPGHFFSINTAIVSPTSRGSISINSSNPFDPPVIDPGFFKNDLDVQVLREGVKLAKKFVTAPVWDGYILSMTGALANATTDAEIEQVIRNTAGTSGHIIGSAAMSAKDAGYGVVNPDLLVKGAKGLRIIDVSVLPFVPSAHTQAAAYAIAERGADLIKAAWLH